MVITWLDFGTVLLKTVILANFLLTFRKCFFKVKHYFGHISGMVGPIDVKRKGSASVWYWYNMWPWPLTSLMALTLDVSRSNFKIPVSQELLVWLMGNENEVSWYDNGSIAWHCPLTTPMTLTLEFQGQSLKLLYLRNGAADWHGMKRMWVIHSWPWYWRSVTMVGWADVPDSERSDFRCRRAVDISSFYTWICYHCSASR